MTDDVLCDHGWVQDYAAKAEYRHNQMVDMGDRKGAMLSQAIIARIPKLYVLQYMLRGGSLNESESNIARAILGELWERHQ